MLRSEITTPKLAFPFRLSVSGRYAVTVEQDSPEEVESCLVVLLMTPQGTRIEVPDYGIPDGTFLQGGIGTPEVRNAIERWEGRADVELTADELTDLQQRVRIHLLER